MGIYGPSFSVTAIGPNNVKRSTKPQEPFDSPKHRDSFQRWDPPIQFDFDIEGVNTFLIRVMEVNDDASTMVIGEATLELKDLQINKGFEKVISVSLTGKGEKKGEIRVGLQPNFDLNPTTSPRPTWTGVAKETPSGGQKSPRGFVAARSRSTLAQDTPQKNSPSGGSSSNLKVGSSRLHSDQNAHEPPPRPTRPNLSQTEPPPRINREIHRSQDPSHAPAAPYPVSAPVTPHHLTPAGSPAQRRSADPGHFSISEPPAAVQHKPTRLVHTQPEPDHGRNRRVTMLPTRALNLTLNRFSPAEVIRNNPPIAKGSFGTVYTGRVPGILKTVVIKDMHCVHQQSIDEWQKELVMMSQNASDFIAEVYGFCATGTCLTIIMEYFPLGDLFNILHTKSALHPLSTLQRMRMARHCALGVAFLHNNGVVHRDIKSMNILCTEDYACKITDFGTAKLVNDSTLGLVANEGTPVWMAPEVRFGQYGPACDVYSLGLVLFEIFVGNLAPYWSQETQSLTLPREYRSSSIVQPCINPTVALRPTALQVSEHLDVLIKKTVYAVKQQMSSVEQDQLREAAAIKAVGNDQLESEILVLYYHLLKRPAHVVDQMIDAAFKAQAQ